jgi:hypothetical protein
MEARNCGLVPLDITRNAARRLIDARRGRDGVPASGPSEQRKYMIVFAE